MDSQDSSAPPFHHPLRRQQQPPYSAQPTTIPMAYNPIQQQPQPSNTTYLVPINNPLIPTNSAPAMMQNPRFPMAAQRPLDQQLPDVSPSGSDGGFISGEPARKKMGRPRKYSPDDTIAPVSQISPSAVTPSSDTPTKRRGRPPGSGKKQLVALGIPGVGFTPHVILVNSGEDIASKIMAFAQQGPRKVCILSANGSVNNVTLRQPGMSGGFVTYEGRFEIISLSGSFPTSDSNGLQTAALSVSLAGSDGKVLGGGVAGMLNAASLVQIVVGSFAEDKRRKGGPSSNPAGNPPSDGSSSSDSDDDNSLAPGSGPLAPGSGPYGTTECDDIFKYGLV